MYGRIVKVIKQYFVANSVCSTAINNKYYFEFLQLSDIEKYIIITEDVLYVLDKKHKLIAFHVLGDIDSDLFALGHMLMNMQYDYYRRLKNEAI